MKSTKLALIIHHNDRDGYVSAAIIGQFLKDKNVIIDTMEVDYKSSLEDMIKENELKTEDFETIFIVDYSISNDKNKDFVLALSKRCNLVWIDHHVSSIKYIEKYPELAEIDGYRIIGISGAGLSYIYTIKNKPLLPTENAIIETLEQKNNSFYKVQYVEALDYLDEFECPELIRMTHRYDIFDIDEDVLDFNYGCTIESYSEAYTLLTGKRTNSTAVMIRMVSDGRVIRNYVDKRNKEIIKDYAQDILFYEKSVYDNKKKGMAVNHTMFNSLVFGSLIYDYDFVMVYANEKGIWRHSVYTIHDDMDCSKIAEYFGGGGHPKAAGFCLDSPFYNKKEFKII